MTWVYDLDSTYISDLEPGDRVTVFQEGAALAVWEVQRRIEDEKHAVVAKLLQINVDSILKIGDIRNAVFTKGCAVEKCRIDGMEVI
jgi:hypothetical protein